MKDNLQLLRVCDFWRPALKSRITAQTEAISSHIAPDDQLILCAGQACADAGDLAVGTGAVAVEPIRGSLGRVVLAVRDALAKHRPRVLHCHGMFMCIAGKAGRILARSKGTHLVYEIHGARAFESLYTRRGTPIGWVRFLILYGLESIAILLADSLILVSEDIRKYYPVVRFRRHVAIPRYVNENPLAPGSQSAQLKELRKIAERAHARGQRIAVYCGNAATWQLPELTVHLLAALGREGSWAPVILTTHVAAFRALTESVADDLDWYIASLPPADVPAALALCDLGVILREDHIMNRVASPTKLFEYFFAGLSVIGTSAIRFGKQTIDSTGAGVIADLSDLDDPDAWVMANLHGLHRAELCRSKLRRERESFTWKVGARQLTALYGVSGS